MEMQLDDFLDAIATNNGWYPNANVFLSVFPVQNGGYGNDFVLVVQDGTRNMGEGVADTKLRGAFARENFPSRILRFAGDIIEIEMFETLLVLLQNVHDRLAADRHMGPGDELGLAMFPEGISVHAARINGEHFGQQGFEAWMSRWKFPCR